MRTSVVRRPLPLDPRPPRSVTLFVFRHGALSRDPKKRGRTIASAALYTGGDRLVILLTRHGREHTFAVPLAMWGTQADGFGNRPAAIARLRCLRRYRQSMNGSHTGAGRWSW